jgi:hypothetical protein
MSELLCPQCSRPLILVSAPSFLLHAELTIYRCEECAEEVPFWEEGSFIETKKHWMLTESGQLQDLPPDAPREIV